MRSIDTKCRNDFWVYFEDICSFIVQSRTRDKSVFQAREQNINYEEGTFHVWDVDSWKKVPKDMKVEYSKLEDKSPVCALVF